jgi:hypothetical protein
MKLFDVAHMGPSPVAHTPEWDDKYAAWLRSRCRRAAEAKKAKHAAPTDTSMAGRPCIHGRDGDDDECESARRQMQEREREAEAAQDGSGEDDDDDDEGREESWWWREPSRARTELFAVEVLADSGTFGTRLVQNT